MANWKFVARQADVVQAGPHHVSADGVDAVVINVAGELRAFEGRCPHQGALLGEGEVVDGKIVCRNHGWCFDVESGKRTGGTQCLQRYPLRVLDGRVELDTSVVKVRENGGGSIGFEDIEVGPSSLSAMGQALLPGRLSKLHLWWEEQLEKYGDPYAYSAGPFRIIATKDIEVIAAALRQRPEEFSRTETLRPIFEELGISGVFTEEGDAWRSQRRLAVRALSGRSLEDFFPTLQLVSERLHRRWLQAADDGRTLDLLDELTRYTVDVTTTLTFGVDTNLVGGEESWLLDRLEGLFPLIGKRITAVFPRWKLYKTRKERRVEANLDDLQEWLSEVIEQRSSHDRSAEETRANFLEEMLEARDAEGRPFDESTIFGNAVTMLLAGEDTTANALAFAVHLLLEHPDEMQSLRRSVDEVLGDAILPGTMEIVDRLTACDGVVNETLRMKPPVTNQGLTAKMDTQVGNITVKKGETLLLLTRLASMDPENVPDPEQFRADRWADPTAASRLLRSGAFTPFGSGPRMCPGRALAFLEMRMVLAMLARNFDVVRVGAAEDIEEVFGFVVSPRGLRVRLQRRT